MSHFSNLEGLLYITLQVKGLLVMSYVPGEKKADVREEGRQLTKSWVEEEKTRHLGMEGT